MCTYSETIAQTNKGKIMAALDDETLMLIGAVIGVVIGVSIMLVIN